MTRKVMLNALLFCSMLAGTVWAHHMAEGIISDEIWQMIDENLQEADSPHLNIDFDDVMGSMRVAEDDYGFSEILLYEPIGNGNSQVAPPPDPAPGKRG